MLKIATIQEMKRLEALLQSAKKDLGTEHPDTYALWKELEAEKKNYANQAGSRKVTQEGF